MCNTHTDATILGNEVCGKVDGAVEDQRPRRLLQAFAGSHGTDAHVERLRVGERAAAREFERAVDHRHGAVPGRGGVADRQRRRVVVGQPVRALGVVLAAQIGRRPLRGRERELAGTAL